MRRVKRICLIALILVLVIPIMISVFLRLYAFIEYRKLEIYTFPAEEVLEFSIDDYQKEIELFASDKNIGPIASFDDVVEKAQILWNEEFTVITLAGLHAPNCGDGVEVLFDKDDACWLVRGTIPNDPLPPDGAGWIVSVPHVIIHASGEVLAMWL